ncbi:MAG: mannose-1-phosphate guanylyltransferase [Candidatus Andersenbacteria bacterium]
MNIVLMAGGGGTRLWPLSRKNQPKQFLKLGGSDTLLEQTYKRALALTATDSIFIATLKDYEAKVRQLLPTVPPENIFFEPERRDTAPALAAVAVHLTLRHKGDEPAVFMWSDHVFTAEADYLEDVKKVPLILKDNPDAIVILGHVPTYPETGLGYIEAGELVDNFDDVFRVKQFKEKPDLATAEQYIAAGNFFWNIGSISLQPKYLLQELRVHEPALMAGIDKFSQAVGAGDKVAAAAAYSSLSPVAIDYALLERAPRIFVVTGDYGWSDVGNWAAIQEVFGTSGDHVPQGHHVHVDAKDNFIYNTTSKAVSLIDMHDSIVVVTDDAVLVTTKKSSHKVKEVVAKLEAAGQSHYL